MKTFSGDRLSKRRRLQRPGHCRQLYLQNRRRRRAEEASRSSPHIRVARRLITPTGTDLGEEPLVSID